MADSDSLARNILQGKPELLRGKVELQISYHSGDSPAIVFLHGGLGNRLNWRSQYEYFSNREEKFWHTIWLDTDSLAPIRNTQWVVIDGI